MDLRFAALCSWNNASSPYGVLSNQFLFLLAKLVGPNHISSSSYSVLRETESLVRDHLPPETSAKADSGYTQGTSARSLIGADVSVEGEGLLGPCVSLPLRTQVMQLMSFPQLVTASVRVTQMTALQTLTSPTEGKASSGNAAYFINSSSPIWIHFPKAVRSRAGDVSKGFADADVIVEGEVSLGHAFHFHLETQRAQATPGEEGTMDIVASTQNVSQVGF
jgi:hypothetical protein